MRRNIVVIGASAGGVEALRAIVAGLPMDFPAALLVVLHIPPYGGSVLPAILSRSGPLPARHPASGEKLKPGVILVGPPDHHLVVDDTECLLTRGPKENGHRPAVDVLFRSAARAAGPRAIGIVLSGVLDDGTAGLSAVAARGGISIVQDPSDAVYPGMPTSAMENVDVDYVLPAADIPKTLIRLVQEDVDLEADRGPTPLMKIEADLAMMDERALNDPERPGQPSGFSCPDCNGVLFEIRDGELVRYRCRVGHAWSAGSLLGEQAQQLDSALWMALRGLEEKASLARGMSEGARQRGNPLTARRFEEQAYEATRAANLIRAMLESHVGSPTEMEAGA
jgi:two-component system chemotaxis response regulator CheB